jgi:hypothetical protein
LKNKSKAGGKQSDARFIVVCVVVVIIIVVVGLLKFL